MVGTAMFLAVQCVDARVEARVHKKADFLGDSMPRLSEKAMTGGHGRLWPIFSAKNAIPNAAGFFRTRFEEQR